MNAMSVFVVAFACFLAAQLAVGRGSDPPNIIFLLTDDQDATSHSLNYMPRLGKIMREEGTEFANCFVPTGLCCPSRTSILRGQYCHNTKIWDNGDLNSDTHLSGGLKKFMAENLESETIATVLKDAGYETFLIGKYMNGYEKAAIEHVPVGWDHWMGMTDHSFYGPQFSDQGKLLKTSDNTYQTDYISNVSQNWIMTRDKSKPFFLYISPFAPHSPSTPAERHATLFNNFKAPRNPPYNPHDEIQAQKPSWIGRLPLLNTKQLEGIDKFYRNRLRALQAVDEMLENITNVLESEGIANNTYLFYMGDNGQHFGDFRLPAGKRQAYDTDIRVPFLVRGPGVKGAVNVTESVMSIDLFSTWIELAGANMPTTYAPDGKSLVPLLHGNMPPQPTVNTFRSVVLAEMYGGTSNMGKHYSGAQGFKSGRFWDNTYQAVRVINGSDWAEGANWMYAEWCTGETEFYDVSSDPHQIYNLASTTDAALLEKLSSLVKVLGSCAGESCSNINLVSIAEPEESYLYDNGRLKCFNPPDHLRDSRSVLDDSIWDLVEEDDSYCQTVIDNGFPYADSDEVPDRILNLWDSCQKKTE